MNLGVGWADTFALLVFNPFFPVYLPTFRRRHTTTHHIPLLSPTYLALSSTIVTAPAKWQGYGCGYLLFFPLIVLL